MTVHAGLLDAGGVLGALAALGFVLALIWGGQRLVLRSRGLPFGRQGLGRRGAGRRLQLMESIALDTRRRLHLVRCDDTYMLIETGGTQDLLVGWVPRPEAGP